MKIITRASRETDHAATGRAARAERIKAGASLRAIAERMDISGAYLSDLERGRRNWTESMTHWFNSAIAAFKRSDYET